MSQISIDTADGHLSVIGLKVFTSTEAAKAAGLTADAEIIDGKRNGITVPPGARFFWAQISDERPDLQGEIVDAETIRKFADYVVSQAGWVDLNHWSRPTKFPERLAKAGRSPEEYVIGSLTEVRVSPDGRSFAEGFLWPKGVNEHADTAWLWLSMAPEKVHCSVGGPAISRVRETAPDGRQVTRLKMLMNHLAICNQGVHVETHVRTSPFGEFAKAILDGVPDEPCDGEGCVPCFIRGEDGAKGAVSAGGPAGINAMGAVPEDLEATATAAGPGADSEGDDEDEDEDKVEGKGEGEEFDDRETLGDKESIEEAKAAIVGDGLCGHFHRGKLTNRRDAVDHLSGCMGFRVSRAVDMVRVASAPKETALFARLARLEAA